MLLAFHVKIWSSLENTVSSIQTFNTRGATNINISLGIRITYSIPHGYGNIVVIATNVELYNSTA